MLLRYTGAGQYGRLECVRQGSRNALAVRLECAGHHSLGYYSSISDIVSIDIAPHNIRCITIVKSYSVIMIQVFDITLCVIIMGFSTISQSDLFPEGRNATIY